MIGSTLYLNTTMSTGIFVAEDAKIALIQTNNNKTTTEYFEGVKNVEAVINQLNAAADGKYDYEFDAVVEEGATTVIVIKDKNSDGYTLPDANKEPKLTATAKVNKATMTVDVPVVDGFQDTVADKAIAALQDEGYTVTSVKLVTVGSKTEYKLTATKGNVSGYEFTTNTTVYYLVSFKTADTTAQEKLNIQSAYLYAGEEFTVTVNKGSAWGKPSYTMASDSNANFTSATASGNILTIKGTLKSTVSAKCDVTLSWS